MASDRSVWIDFGNDPDYGLLSGRGIGEVAFDIRDPRLTPAYLDAVKARGLRPRFYSCWNWGEVAARDGAGFAQWTHERMLAIGWRGNAPVDLNDETHSPVRIAALLKRWRELRPTRETLWTMEGHQADLFAPIAQQIREAAVDVGPQCYFGNMERIESAYEVRAWERIVPIARIRPFLDGAQLAAWWYGVAFTQGRLLP